MGNPVLGINSSLVFYTCCGVSHEDFMTVMSLFYLCNFIGKGFWTLNVEDTFGGGANLC